MYNTPLPMCIVQILQPLLHSVEASLHQRLMFQIHFYSYNALCRNVKYNILLSHLVSVITYWSVLKTERIRGEIFL